MATVSDKKTLDCPLCFKIFTTPRVLSCFHTFCEKCLSGYIESKVQGGSKFACPLCAAETVPSNSKLAIDKWASTFPLNTLMCSLIESSVDVDDEDNKCKPCTAGGESKKAEFLCTICQEKLCKSCNELHKRDQLLRKHTIVCIDKIAQHKESNVNFDQECGRHGDKVKLFCVKHRVLCCTVCVAKDHCQCNDVRSIDDVAHGQSQWPTSFYLNIIQDIKQLETEIENILTEKKSNATQILREKDQILHDMDNRIDRAINHLNKLRNTFKDETDQLYQDTERLILEKEKTLQSFIVNMENSREILEVVETTGTPQQKFTMFENIRSQIASHYDQLKSKFKDDVEVHFSMKSENGLDNIECSLNSLGSVDLTSKSSTKSLVSLQNANIIIENLTSRSKLSTVMCAAQVEKVEDIMTAPLTFVKSVTTDKLGSRTWFTGSTCLGDGRLVMCDYWNERLVELDDEYNVVKEYKIEGQPTDVAAGHKDNEIYIAVSTIYIYKCTLHTNLTIDSRIKAPSVTYGLAMSGDHIIVGTRDAVLILSQNGSIVRVIPKSGGHSYIAVSQKKRTIYHKDNNDVVCRTWEGQEVFRYQQKQLKYPCGICTDKYNNVYICGANSHNVHLVSHDGQRSRIVQLRNISMPYSVVLRPRKKQLIVISWEEDTVCEIYKFAL